MGNMYNIGEIITADGDNYRVLGRITYLNKADGKTWDEYRLRAENFNNDILFQRRILLPAPPDIIWLTEELLKWLA